MTRLPPPTFEIKGSVYRFTMGSPENEPGRFSNEGPQHQVTWAQWNDVRDWALAGGSSSLSQFAHYPPAWKLLPMLVRGGAKGV